MKPDETYAFGSFCAASVFCTVMIFEKISHWVMTWRHEDLEARSAEARNWNCFELFAVTNVIHAWTTRYQTSSATWDTLLIHIDTLSPCHHVTTSRASATFKHRVWVICSVWSTLQHLENHLEVLMMHLPSRAREHKKGANRCKDIQSDARKCKGYERKEAFKLWKWTRVESRTSTYQPKFGAFFSAKMAILRTSSCTHRTRSERLGRSRHVQVAKLGKFNSSANPRLLIFPPSSPPFFLNQDPSLNRGLRPSLFRHHIFSSFHSSSCIIEFRDVWIPSLRAQTCLPSRPAKLNVTVTHGLSSCSKLSLAPKISNSSSTICCQFSGLKFTRKCRIRSKTKDVCSLKNRQ